MKKINILLFGNGSSENHGCEAIALTCAELLKELYDNIYIGTLNKRADSNLKEIPFVELVEYHYEGKPTLINKIKKKIFKQNSKYWFDNIINKLDQIDLAISVGGDNYCYNNNEWLYYLQDIFEAHDIPTVLLGCSVNSVDELMKKYLNKYNLILTRETLSYQSISSFHNNVKLLPDPAFSLQTVKDNFEFNDDKKYIGINLSPLIMEYENNKGLAYLNFTTLIKYIIEQTEYDILLIPHVVFNEKYGDIEILTQLYQDFSSPRIRIAYSHDCRKLKYYISKCEILIAARTHASIAAYSSNVPCLVLGYSNKSLGIAKDLFGNTENYVIPVQNLENKSAILKSFKWILNNQEKIKKCLEIKNNQYKNIMPKYSEYINEIINK